jgi:hypothetical protein
MGILLSMLAPTLPSLSTLDRQELQTLLLAEHEERIAPHRQLLQREQQWQERESDRASEAAARSAPADAVRVQVNREESRQPEQPGKRTRQTSTTQEETSNIVGPGKSLFHLGVRGGLRKVQSCHRTTS